MSKLVSAFKNFRITALVAFCLINTLSFQAQDLPLANGKKYTIGEINVTGATSYNEQTVIAYTGLRSGEEIYIPGDKISEVIKKLWDLGLFSNINIYVTNIEGNVADLEIQIEELPTLSEAKIKGVKKSKQEELIEETKLTPGIKVTENLIATTRNYIENKYKEDGYLNTEVNVFTVPVEDTLPTTDNLVNLMVDIDKGERVKVEDIVFIGNEELSDRKLRGAMKNTKEQRFFRFWKRSKFVREDYIADKESIIDEYAQEGFRDARIISDTLIKVDDDDISLKLVVEEGDRYYFGNIDFIGNTVYTDAQLQRVLGIEKGDVYNGVLLEKQIADNTKPNANDLTNLYQNNGYLFSQINPVEVKVYNDTIDFEIRIREGKIAYFDEITVVGNDKTKDHVIYREMRTKPGFKYSKADVLRTRRELGQLGFFDPQNLIPEFKDVNPQEGTVDLEYSVVESGASQIELQGGYGGGGFVGTLGLRFNNFSLAGLFDKEAYRPLPMGDGQTLALRAQASSYYRTYSLSFSEPWLGGVKPVRLTTSFQHTERFHFDYRTRDVNRDMGFSVTGVTFGIAKRLTVPDNFFILSHALSFQHYDMNNYDIGLFTFGGDGYSNNFSYTIGLTRDDTAFHPFFPTEGSKFDITAKFTPPYSLFNGVDYGNLENMKEYQLQNENGVLVDRQGRPLGPGEDPIPNQTKIDQEKFKWLEYYKIKFGGTWYTSLFNFGPDQDIVLMTHAEFGFLGAYNSERGIPPFDRFFLGGDGMGNYSIESNEYIALRGYENQSLVPIDRTLNPATGRDGATVYNKYSLELRYPVTLKPTASIFALTFFDAGASYDGFQDFDPFQLYRSAGVGLRVYMPAFGLLGIDFGYGFDPEPGLTQPSGWQTHFTIGKQF